MPSRNLKFKISNLKLHKSKKQTFWQPFLYALAGIIIVWFILSPYADFNPAWKSPEVLKSQNGVLNVTLQAKKAMVNIGGKMVQSMVYNGDYPSKTWEVSGGDRIKVHLENDLDQSTNLHFHGSHVSPKGNSDNVLLNIKPGETFDYEYNLPKTHPPGLYWYHPHYHPVVEDQVLGGMAGAIIVRGNVDQLPGIKDVPEKLLVLTTQDTNTSTIRLVNGMSDPTMYVRPFQTVRLRVLNASADDYYNFAVADRTLHVISRDGNTLTQVQDVKNEVMGPGDRAEFLLQAGPWGDLDVQSLPFNEGFQKYRLRTFMHIKVAGFPVLPTAIPTTLLPMTDLRNAKVDNVRTLTFSEGGTNDNPTFLFDGKMFNPNVVNQVMVLGTTEEWHLVNNSNEVHPFHIHINPFQVISINGKPVDRPNYDDTFPIPVHSTVVIRTRYLDFDGKYVLHCHILFHEDHGMMQIVEVVKPGAQPASDNGVPLREGMPGMDMMNTLMNTTGTKRYSKEHPANLDNTSGMEMMDGMEM